MAKVEMGYWAARGFGTLVRIVLEAAGVEYEEKRYQLAEADKWFGEDKPALKEKFALVNLPYVKFDDIIISEIDSCMRLIAQKWAPHLLGTNKHEIANCEVYFSALLKGFQKAKGPTMSPDTPSDEERIELVENNAVVLTAINQQLAKHKFVAGEHVTIADVCLYEAIPFFNMIHEETMKKYDNFDRFKADFEAVDWFAKYKASDRWLEGPCNPPNAGLNFGV